MPVEIAQPDDRTTPGFLHYLGPKVPFHCLCQSELGGLLLLAPGTVLTAIK